MTNLHTVEIVFFRNLTKIGPDENKAIYSSSLAIAQELCFLKQHYENIVPSKPGINR